VIPLQCKRASLCVSTEGAVYARTPRYPRPVDARDLRDLIRFDDDGPRHEPLFESDHLWSEVVCLQGPQGIGPIADRDSDAICTVLAGRVAVQVDRGRRRLEQWGCALVPKGSELTIRNASDEPSVVLLIAAPPPTPHPWVE
jgi:quercetin dioxygenase-like cupin family protein